MSFRAFWNDERGQSLGISNYILSLLAGAIVLYFVVDRVGDWMLQRAAEHGGGPVGTTATSQLAAAGAALALLFAVTATLGLLLRAVRQQGLI